MSSTARPSGCFLRCRGERERPQVVSAGFPEPVTSPPDVADEIPLLVRRALADLGMADPG